MQVAMGVEGTSELEEPFLDEDFLAEDEDFLASAVAINKERVNAKMEFLRDEEIIV